MFKDKYKYFLKGLPKVVSSTNFIIGPHPDGYVLRDANGRECSPVLSSAELLQRWCTHNGYKPKKPNAKTKFIKNNGRTRHKQ